MAKSKKDREKDGAAEALAAMTGGIVPPDVGDAPLSPDDAVAAPAPDASVFAPKRRTADLIAQRRLDTYRTAIPILLTLSVIFLLTATLKWIAPDDSPFREWSIWVPIVFLVAGAGLLAVAVLNMLHVQHELQITR